MAQFDRVLGREFHYPGDHCSGRNCVFMVVVLMNWNSDDEQEFGNQEIETFSTSGWWCCLLAFLGAVGIVVALFIGYILFA